MKLKTIQVNHIKEEVESLVTEEQHLQKLIDLDQVSKELTTMKCSICKIKLIEITKQNLNKLAEKPIRKLLM